MLDVVSADLADALTGGHTGRTTLAELAASNLFVQGVGTGGQWYRLHRLIADVLRARIAQPRTFRDLHRRAAEWYLRHAMPVDAVRYALRGGLWPLAAELVGGHLLTLVVRHSTREIDDLLSAMPRDALLSHPELAAALAAARMYRGSAVEIGELSAAAHSGMDRLPPHRAERLRVVLDLSSGLRELLAARIEAGTAVAVFAVDLTRRMAGQGSRPAPVQVAALTDREQLILRYLASTLSNTEIAAELYLSVNTVKTHQRMVYRKLAADGRRDAVRRAKELRLI